MPVARVDKKATEKLQNELKAAREQLSAGVGLALAQWGLVEAMLTFLFVSVLDRTRSPLRKGLIPWEVEHPQRRMFHTICNAVMAFDARLDMVGAAIEQSDLSKDLKSLWPGISKRIKKGYRKRHEVAHFMIDEMGNRDGSISVWIAPFGNTVASLKDKRLNRTHLDHKANSFTELGHALSWYRDAVEIRRRRQKGPRPPEPALIQRVRQALKNPSLEEPE